MGLIDGLASSSQIAREKLNVEDLVSYTYKPNPWEEVMGRFGTSFGHGVASFFRTADNGSALNNFDMRD